MRRALFEVRLVQLSPLSSLAPRWQVKPDREDRTFRQYASIGSADLLPRLEGAGPIVYALTSDGVEVTGRLGWWLSLRIAVVPRLQPDGSWRIGLDVDEGTFTDNGWQHLSDKITLENLPLEPGHSLLVRGVLTFDGGDTRAGGDSAVAAATPPPTFADAIVVTLADLPLSSRDKAGLPSEAETLALAIRQTPAGELLELIAREFGPTFRYEGAAEARLGTAVSIWTSEMPWDVVSRTILGLACLEGEATAGGVWVVRESTGPCGSSPVRRP